MIEPWEEPGWYDDYKAMEQWAMVLKDQYAELARAIGSPSDSWWGDPLEGHDKVMARARDLMNLANEQ